MTSNLRNSLPAASFFWVFPFFFFYHSVAALGLMPPVLGNWWTVSHILALAALAPFVLLDATRIDIRPHLPVLGLGAYCAAVGVYHFAFGEPYATGWGPLIATAKLLISWCGLYLLGYYLTKSDRLGDALIVCCLVMAALTPVLVYADALALYQFMSQAVVVTALYPLAVFWKERKAALVGGVALAAVVYLGSRSELLGLAAVLAGWSILCIMHGRWRLVVQMTGAGVVAGLIIAASIQAITIVPAMFATSTEVQMPRRPAPQQSTLARQMEFADLSSSKSVEQRTALFWSGLDAIKESPIAGDYSGQIREFNDPGSYIHNALSVWRQYGLVPFVLFAALSLWGLGVSLKRIVIERVTDPMVILTGILCGYTFVLMVFAKSVYWPMPALAWGLFAASIEAGRGTGREARRPLTR